MRAKTSLPRREILRKVSLGWLGKLSIGCPAVDVMPPIGQIPGFYYDPEKRKYFKVEEHVHHSHPYSRENIAKRHKAEQQVAQKARESQLRSDNLVNLRPFQRWAHTTTNVGGYMNAREVGLTAAKLHDREPLQARLLHRQRVWQVRSTESGLEKLTCFAVRESSGHAMFGTQGGLVYALPVQSEETNVRLVGRHQDITRFTSKVTAMAMSQNPETNLFVCSSLGKDNYSGIIQIGRFGQSEDRICEIISVIIPKRKQDIYCLAMNRYVPEEFAVGGEYDVLVASVRYTRSLNPPGNCLALEFLGPHALAAGSRNGIIRVYDSRGQEKTEGTGLTIRHPSSISQIKQINDHLMVVEGLQNSLAMYDLRNTKALGNLTTPIVKYSGHVNSITFNLGFDVSPSESILAAAGDDGFVRLWSIQSGQRLHAKISEVPFDDNVIGLQFSGGRDNGIWVAGSELEYWST